MELLPHEQVVFNRIKHKIKEAFENYGFWPLDTPMIEKTEILLAKGGGETSKQIYHIEKGAHSQEQALRFDLTVPLARYVAQYHSKLSFPFRRYQIGKVYRGERSQKGRYREFYQCDIDIIGREKLAIENDAEIPSIIFTIFQEIGVGDVIFRMNNRKLLNAFFDQLKIEDKEEVLRIIDKLEKIGEENVIKELEEIDLDKGQIAALLTFIQVGANNEETLRKMKEVSNEEAYVEALQELEKVFALMQKFGVPKENIKIDPSITRGLDYYTGTVYETFIQGHEDIGSICSGGRYDDLASNFSKEKFPGIGLSIGLTRLFYKLQEVDMLKEKKEAFIEALVLPLAEEDKEYAIDVVTYLREHGISSQIYLEMGKMKKKFSYSDSIGAKYAVIIGQGEREGQLISVKDMDSGDQKLMSKEDFLQMFA